MYPCILYSTNPGVEKVLLSEQTVISHVAISWQPAAAAKPLT